MFGRKIFFKLTLCLLWFFCSCQTNQSLLPVLENIEIEGNYTLSKSDIIKHIALDPSSRVPFWGVKKYYDPSLLDVDLLRIEKYYETQGIYGTRVVQTSVERLNNKATLKIRLQEGRVVKVKKLTTKGFPLSRLPQFELSEGSRFSQDLYEQDKSSLTQTLKNSGYPFAKVEGRVLVDVENGSCEIFYTFSNLTKYVIGAVKVRGNKEISENQIIEHSGIIEGEVFSHENIIEAQRALYSLNVFRFVEIKSENPKDNTLPLTIQVDEGSFQSVGIGLGLGVETGRQEIRTRIQYNHNNFFGGLRRFESELRPAYIYVPNFFDPKNEGLGGEARLGFFQPDVLLNYGFHHLGLSVTSSYQRELMDGFSVNSGSGRIGLIWPTNSLSTVEFGYNANFFALLNYPPEVQQCGGNTCLVSFFDQKVVYDKRENQVNPRNGYWISIVLNEAGVAGSFKYLSIAPEGRIYFPGFWGTTYAFRIVMGSIVKFDNSESPIPKRFYAGGSGSHRGFAMRRLSPQVEAQSRHRLLPVGGNSMLTSSAEWRVPITNSFSNILFFDGGDVRSQSFVFEKFEFNSAVGCGFKYDSPIAPIRFDVGYRLNSPARFSHEPRFAFHLTLGNAF